MNNSGINMQGSLEIDVKLNNIQEEATKGQNALNKLGLSKESTSKINKSYDSIIASINQAREAMSRGLGDPKNMKQYQHALDEIVSSGKSLNQQTIAGEEINKAYFKSLNQELTTAKTKLLSLKTAFMGNKENLDLFTKLEKAMPKGSKGMLSEFKRDLMSGNTAKIMQFRQGLADSNNIQGLDIYRQILKSYQSSGIFNESQNVKNLQNRILNPTSPQDIKNIEELTQRLSSVTAAQKQFATSTEQSANALREEADQALASQQELDRLKQRLAYFFGLQNMLNLIKRLLTSVFNTIKELDSAMAETAVVTSMSIKDLWDKLPEYTSMASQFGSSILGVYQASTLYYQQGLRTNRVMEITAETLKMAKIAGLDYKDATDAMTAALRGFNMELNATSAQRVNDVYSKLAAITASDVEEISTAMTKTASLAHNANMEFETTAAHLAHIIETTRESAETAGTAMKTVIARFTELKKDPKGLIDVEGESVDANKIETALKSIGVTLRGTNGQFRELDDVFLDIAQKWDSLSVNTQRYIATIAAGSRQQSRFIAMMSNYDRTMELVEAAHNAAGASAAQFEKTTESLEYHINQLTVAWDNFKTQFTSSEFLKGTIDFIKILIEGFNKLSSFLGNSFPAAIVKILLIVNLFKLGSALMTPLFSSAVASFKAIGVASGQSMAEGIISGVKNQWGMLKSLGSGFATMFSTKRKSAIDNLMKSPNKLDSTNAFAVFGKTRKEWLNNQALNQKFSTQQINAYYTNAQAGNQFKSQEFKDTLSAQLDEQKISIVTQRMQALGQATMIAGTAFAIGANYLDKWGEKEHSDGLKTLAAAVKGLGVAFTILGVIISVFGKQIVALGVKIGISLPWLYAIGAILAVVVALIAAFVSWLNRPTEAERQAEALEHLNEALSETKEQLDHVKQGWTELVETYDKIEKLTKGTEAWREEVQKANSAVLELVSSTEGLRYEVGEDGILRITNYDTWKEEQEAKLKRDQAASAAVGYANEIKQLEKEYKDSMGVRTNIVKYNGKRYNIFDTSDQSAEAVAARKYYDTVVNPKRKEAQRLKREQQINAAKMLYGDKYTNFELRSAGSSDAWIDDLSKNEIISLLSPLGYSVTKDNAYDYQTLAKIVKAEQLGYFTKYNYLKQSDFGIATYKDLQKYGQGKFSSVTNIFTEYANWFTDDTTIQEALDFSSRWTNEYKDFSYIFEKWINNSNTNINEIKQLITSTNWYDKSDIKSTYNALIKLSDGTKASIEEIQDDINLIKRFTKPITSFDMATLVQTIQSHREIINELVDSEGEISQELGEKLIAINGAFKLNLTETTKGYRILNKDNIIKQIQIDDDELANAILDNYEAYKKLYSQINQWLIEQDKTWSDILSETTNENFKNRYQGSLGKFFTQANIELTKANFSNVSQFNEISDIANLIFALPAMTLQKRWGDILAEYGETAIKGLKSRLTEIGIDEQTLSSIDFKNLVNNDKFWDVFEQAEDARNKIVNYWADSFDLFYNRNQALDALNRQIEKVDSQLETVNNITEASNLYSQKVSTLLAQKDLYQINSNDYISKMEEILDMYGVRSYFSWDESKGLFTLNNAQIDTVTNSSLGKNIEEAEKLLKQYSDDFNDAEKSIRDIDKQIREINAKQRDTRIAATDELAKALYNRDKKQLDDTKEANGKLLEGIKESINNRKQVRDDQKSQQSLLDKERRLLYLQQDTTGGNQLEIIRLQKELEDERQNYTDTLIERGIADIEKEANDSYEQRQELLNTVQEGNYYIEESARLLKQAINEDGSINWDSEAMLTLIKVNNLFTDDQLNAFKQEWSEKFTTGWSQIATDTGTAMKTALGTQDWADIKTNVGNLKTPTNDLSYYVGLLNVALTSLIEVISDEIQKIKGNGNGEWHPEDNGDKMRDWAVWQAFKNNNFKYLIDNNIKIDPYFFTAYQSTAGSGKQSQIDIVFKKDYENDNYTDVVELIMRAINSQVYPSNVRIR